MGNEKNKIWEILHEINENIKELNFSIKEIKNALQSPQPFDDGRIVEIDSLKTQKEEIKKQTKEMRKQTKYLLCTFILAILTAFFNIIVTVIQNWSF